ncbi:GAF domain-containing protein [Sphingomonas sp. T9W2]|uniref:GAF domain-containing protein n=1 Tax=Sphingomonas sp. T9W2 TaxID=3143183 RepID=UPI0031F500E5
MGYHPSALGSFRDWPHAGINKLYRDGDRAVRDLAIDRSGVLGRMRDPELATIVGFTAAEYKTAMAGLSIVTGRRQILLGAIGTDVYETPLEDSFCAVAVQRPDEPLIVPDATRDPRFATFRTVTGQPFVRFYAGVPVLDRNGFALGALCIADRTPRHEAFDPTMLLIRAREIERLLRS